MSPDDFVSVIEAVFRVPVLGCPVTSGASANDAGWWDNAHLGYLGWKRGDNAEAYRDGRDHTAAGAGVREVLTSTCDLRNATPYLFLVRAKDWLGNHALSEEVFGPLGLIITVDSVDEMIAVAKSFEGQLTVTLHLDDGDIELGRKAGRVLANGFPTGVEVCDAMVHGGPYPASTNFGATSVGTMAIRRFLRPVSYQNLPEKLISSDLQSA